MPSIVIPDTVTEIGNSAFSNSSIEKIDIPNSIKSIGDKVFNGCVSLKNVFNKSSLDFKKRETSNGHIAYYADNVFTWNEESESWDIQ